MYLIADEVFDLNFLFDKSQDENFQKDDYSQNNIYSNSFSNFLLPINHILTEENKKGDESLINLSKFKELNMNKVKEDMLYYCAPVDILSKLDINNNEYLYQESDSEFLNDLSVKVFIQRQEELKKLIGKDKQKASLVKPKNLDNWTSCFTNKKNETSAKDKEDLKEVNNIFKIIQNAMKILIKEKNSEAIFKSLNEIISNLKIVKIQMEKIGYEMYVNLEKNLVFLIELIEKIFSKDEKLIQTFLEIFINMTNYFKSNRLFFILIQFLNKYKNITDKIKIGPRQILSEESISLEKIIQNMKIDKKINIKDLKDFIISKGYNINKENNASDDDFWIVNNKDELFIFSNENNTKNIFYYKINIRNNCYGIEDYPHELIDFGKIDLNENDDNKVIEINISIKNDLIYLCYLNDSNKELKITYKIFSTSMLLLKEGSIKLNDFDCSDSYLYSDQKYLYVISGENKIFVLKKNYSMENFEFSKLAKDSNIKNSIKDDKNHNCFNINNFIILEKKKESKIDLFIVDFYKENNEYKYRNVKMNLPDAFFEDNEKIKYIISYNDNTFLVTKINANYINISSSDFNAKDFILNGIQFLPFDYDCSYSYTHINNNDLIYKNLLREYSIFVNLYGNFDRINKDLENILLSYPYSFCFNINSNNFNYVLEQIISKETDFETKMYYFIIAKQFICCLYHTNNIKIEQINKLIDYMKHFVLDIKKNISDGKNKKFINIILKEIIYISSYLDKQIIIEIKDIKNIINEKNELNYKTKILLLDLLLSQPLLSENTELFNLILEFDKSFLLAILDEKQNNETKNKIFTSYYKLYKNIMTKSLCLMNNYYKESIKNICNDELFTLTYQISKNVIEICKLYQNNLNSELCKLPILFQSINFTMFYLILQRLISNDYFNKDMSILSSLYNVLLTLDKLNINKNTGKNLDLNNLIEIKNFFIENEDDQDEKENEKHVINFSSKQNIIFKTNITDIEDLNNYMHIKLIRKKYDKNLNIDLNDLGDYIYYDVDGIEVQLKKLNREHTEFILNVIPIKDEKEYLKNKSNENFKIINLIQKTILHYFLFLFEKIDEKLNNFIKEQNVRNFCKLYHTEFLQFIYTNNINIDMSIFDLKKGKGKKNDGTDEEKKEEENKDKENKETIIFKSDALINEINRLFNYSNKNNIELPTEIKSPMKLIYDDFFCLFGKIHNNELKKDDKTLQKLLSYKDIDLSDSSFVKLIEQFNSDIIKKNKILGTIKTNDSINKMILKIFQIIIKYYNYNTKLIDLIRNNKYTSDNEDYKLFCDIYEESCQMKMVYNQEKSRFIDEKFEEQSQNYINITMAKLDFIYEIIIPSFDESLKYDKSIVKNLIDLIRNQNFSPKEIIKYSEIQNLNCNIKVIELLIINNLLINLSEEENLRFILYIINNKYNKNNNSNNYSIPISLLDSIYGSDFSQMEQVKNQFHLLLDTIINRYIKNNNFNNLSLSTKISLYQCLLWKYKGRDFNILPKIINCFDDLKQCKLNEYNNNILFKLKHEKIHNITNYNIDTFNNMKFEIFKIISSQIIVKIKDNLNNGNIKGIDTNLKLTRNISNITDYKNIISLVIAYFSFINKNNRYYHEFILFFYKNIINSKHLIELIIESYSEVILKIFDIIFEKENDNNNQSMNTKIILLKLFLQILENINNEDKIACLIDCCMQYNKNEFNPENIEEINPFEYLISKFKILLEKEQNEFLKYYYFKIFLFCLNKIDTKKSHINKGNLLDINILLSSNNNLNNIESKFSIKNDYGKKFEEYAIFCHLESNRISKLGNLLCYIDNESLFNKYEDNDNLTYFNYKDFSYNIEQKKNSENIFVIMDESLDGKINKIKAIEKKSIKEITLLDNKKNNLFYNNYLENNSSYIYDSLISKLMEKKLNYKGINFILKLIYYLLDNITVENAEKIIKYIFEYINDEKVLENEKEWNFCSFEYFINEMNSFQNVFAYLPFNINTEKIEQEIDINKDKIESQNNKYDAPLLISSLFNYIIEGEDFTIEYKSNNKIRKTFVNELHEIKKLTNESTNETINMNNLISSLFNFIEEEDFPIELHEIQKLTSESTNKTIKMNNLSFYKAHKVNSKTNITDNSLLLIEQITVYPELINILEMNKNKIKSIIVADIDIEKLKEYLSKISIPIYSVKRSFYTKLTKFFIEGEGGEYISSNNNNLGKEEIISIYKPSMLLNQSQKFEDKNNDEINNNFYTSEENLGLEVLFNQGSEIVEYLNESQIQEKLAEFQKKIAIKYNEINFDLYKVYCLENVKLCYRILYEILTKEKIISKIKSGELYKNIDKILEIFDLLCKEYYFNISNKLSVNNLQNLLKKYLKSLNKESSFSQKWLQNLMKIFSKPKDKCEDLDCKEYDKILFIFRDCNNLELDEYFINKCFNMINDIIEKSVVDTDKIVKKENNLRNDNSPININSYITKVDNNRIFKSEFIPYFLYEIFNGIYDTITNNKINSKLFVECFIKNDFHYSIIKFIDEIIEIKNYFSDKNNNIPKSKTLLVQFGFKYLDICFYIFFKEKKFNLVDYWIKSNNFLFLFYSSYKMLATEKHYEEIDYKELFALIAYISDSVDLFKENNQKIDKEKDNKLQFKMKMNSFNKLKLENNDSSSKYSIITSFSLDKLPSSDKNNINYKKIAIFSYNKETKKYSLQDVIDTSDSSSIKKDLSNYLQLFKNDEIFLVPMDKISTCLYAFGNNFNHSLGVNGKLAKFYDTPMKCEGLPKNIWNIGYGNNYCLALSEEDNKIYACGCNKGGGFNSTPRALFTNETRINNIPENTEKIKYFNFATGNCDSSLLINEKGELFGIGNNEEKIFGLEDKKLKYPTKLELNVYEKKNNENNNNEENKINEKLVIGKIKSFYIGYKNCYIINEEGKLFGLGNNSSFQISDEEIETYTKWKNIPLPEDCTKFVDCAVGENYILCLVEDTNGHNKLYAKGKNQEFQCGIVKEPLEESIKNLTICDNTKHLSFKKIYARNSQSAAITLEGDLYIWGNTNYNKSGESYNTPTLITFDESNKIKNDKECLDDENVINENKINVNTNENNKIIVDDVVISRSHMLIIARKYENGEYIRKLYGYGDNSKGALGLTITENKNEIVKNSIKEIPLMDDKNNKLTPIKMTIGDNKSYILCVNENELLNEINQLTKKDNQDCCINISNIYIERVGKNLLDFYESKNLNDFISLFKTITNKALTEFIDSLDEIRFAEENNEIPSNTIDFHTFFNYIRKNELMKELHRIFIRSESTEINLNTHERKELNSIFNYLNTKSQLITNNIFKFCLTNEKSEYKPFLQKAIGNNISYLSAEKRLEKFNELLSKKTLKRGTERRVEVDRFKANQFYDKFNEDVKNQISDVEFNKTIFGQVYQSFGKTKGEDFFIQKGRRLFIVCLKNEYASDSGGPYHEVISGICSELQSDYLNMFIKTPNHKHDIGLLRDKFIPNPQATRDINEKTYEFLGKIMASAITSGEALDLNFHPVVWKALLGNEISFYEYENIDYTFFSLINNLEKELKNYEENKNSVEKLEDLYKLNFVIKNSSEDDIELKPNGEKIEVDFNNLKEYISLSKKMRANEFIAQINFIKNGFNSVIPSSIIQVLNWRQLEEMVCGKNKLDIRDLKKHTKYDGFNEKDDVIKWFWEWLEECNDHEQSLYLKFVSGRARLPKEKNFNYEHVIVKNDYNSNDALPQSATCFFTLKLPVYKDKETLTKKLKYSILNCDEIDGDH